MLLIDKSGGARNDPTCSRSARIIVPKSVVKLLWFFAVHSECVRRRPTIINGHSIISFYLTTAHKSAALSSLLAAWTLISRVSVAQWSGASTHHHRIWYNIPVFLCVNKRQCPNTWIRQMRKFRCCLCGGNGDTADSNGVKIAQRNPLIACVGHTEWDGGQWEKVNFWGCGSCGTLWSYPNRNATRSCVVVDGLRWHSDKWQAHIYCGKALE